MKRLAIFLGALLLPAVAWAQQDETPLFGPGPKKEADLAGPMMFQRVDKHGLLMYGQIHLGDTARFREALSSGSYQTLYLTSYGGVVDEAINIAHMVRSNKMTTRVPKGLPCVSACNFIFLGGVVRYVEPGASFEVHVFALPDITTIRDRINFPPTDFLAFAQRYSNHPVLTTAQFAERAKTAEATVKEMQKLMASKGIKEDDEGKLLLLKLAAGSLAEQGFDSNMARSLVEYAYIIKGKVSCPVQRQGQESPASPEQPQPQQPKQSPVISQDLHLSVDLLNLLNAAAPDPQAQPHPQQPQQQEEQKPTEVLDFPNDPCMEGAKKYYLATEAVSEEVKDLEQSSARQAAQIATFLTQMSVSLRFLTEFANIPNDKPRPLTSDELRSFNIVNAD